MMNQMINIAAEQHTVNGQPAAAAGGGRHRMTDALEISK